MNDYSSFGLKVKAKLIEPPMRTQAWLLKEVRNRTGLYIDPPYMSKILKGKCQPPKIVQAIKDILNITD